MASLHDLERSCDGVEWSWLQTAIKRLPSRRLVGRLGRTCLAHGREHITQCLSPNYVSYILRAFHQTRDQCNRTVCSNFQAMARYPQAPAATQVTGAQLVRSPMIGAPPLNMEIISPSCPTRPRFGVPLAIPSHDVANLEPSFFRQTGRGPSEGPTRR